MLVEALVEVLLVTQVGWHYLLVQQLLQSRLRYSPCSLELSTYAPSFFLVMKIVAVMVLKEKCR